VPASQLQYAADDRGKKVKVGPGGFATIYQAKWHGLEVAVKIIKQKMTKEMKEAFNREVGVMATLRHPNVVLLLGVCEGLPSFIMPFMKKGSLQDMIDKNADVPFPLRMKYLVDTARGMAFVHAFQICHGDLKPQNILVDANDAAYVADVGMSKVKDCMVTGTIAQGRNLLFSAPELATDGTISLPSDVYSFGILMWTVATFRTPFAGTFATAREFERKISTTTGDGSDGGFRGARGGVLAGGPPPAAGVPRGSGKAGKDTGWHVGGCDSR